MGDLGTEAARYAALGLAVIPLQERGKIPNIEGGSREGSNEPDYVAAWWADNPNDNIGIVTGEDSGGLIVIDVDIDEAAGKDGMASLLEWEADHGKLPETAVSVTGRGGRHILYRTGEDVRNTVNAALGIDIRGDGGYIVAPPSVHPNGEAYRWERDPSDGIADADDNVLAFIRHIAGGRERGSHPVTEQAGHKPRYELPETIGEGGRNDGLMRYGCSLQGKGLEDAEILAALQEANSLRCSPPLSDREVSRIWDSVTRRYRKGSTFPDRPRATPQPTKADIVQQEDAGETETFKLTTSGTSTIPDSTVWNAYIIINHLNGELKGRFAYDELACHKVVRLPLPWDSGDGTRPVQDSDYTQLAQFAEKNHRFRSKEKIIDAVLNTCMDNSYDPLTEWLDSLVWDGEEYIYYLLPCFLGCDNTDYTYNVMRTWMHGAVARAYEPGTKFDLMPVLVGSQGIGKSTFVSMLCPNKDWYCDNYAELDGARVGEKLRGLWIAEMAELLATKRTQEVEAIKSFLTVCVDHYRPAYGRETEHHPRRCVFMGTTNDEHFLTDKSGNRRFPPIECGIQEPVWSLHDDSARDFFAQAWAQAVHEWKHGAGSLVLTEDAQKAMEERQKDHIEDDPRVGAIQAYLDGLLENVGLAVPHTRSELQDAGLLVCVSELCEKALGMHKTDYYNNRVLGNTMHSIMRNQISGWVKVPKRVKTKGYGAQFCYVPEEYTEEARE